jgi:hypothetical protein
VLTSEGQTCSLGTAFTSNFTSPLSAGRYSFALLATSTPVVNPSKREKDQKYSLFSSVILHSESCRRTTNTGNIVGLAHVIPTR